MHLLILITQACSEEEIGMNSLMRCLRMFILVFANVYIIIVYRSSSIIHPSDKLPPKSQKINLVPRAFCGFFIIFLRLLVHYYRLQKLSHRPFPLFRCC